MNQSYGLQRLKGTKSKKASQQGRNIPTRLTPYPYDNHMTKRNQNRHNPNSAKELAAMTLGLAASIYSRKTHSSCSTPCGTQPGMEIAATGVVAIMYQQHQQFVATAVSIHHYAATFVIQKHHN